MRIKVRLRWNKQRKCYEFRMSRKARKFLAEIGG